VGAEGLPTHLIMHTLSVRLTLLGLLVAGVIAIPAATPAASAASSAVSVNLNGVTYVNKVRYTSQFRSLLLTPTNIILTRV
jgi:hypothetical protein